jgi:carnitine-CoA ligase
MTKNPKGQLRGEHGVRAGARSLHAIEPHRRDAEERVLGDLLRERARVHPERTFLKFREGELTYGEVDEISDRLAAGLAARGVGRHDHVAVMLPNGPDFLYVTFALAKLGAVLVPINIAYKGEILDHVLESSDSSTLIVDESLLDAAAPAAARAGKLRSVIVRTSGGGGTPLPHTGKPTLALHELMGRAGEAPRVRLREGDLQAIMYTSGTTGPSKGVIVPHALALICAEDSLRHLAYEPGETIYCPLPLFHAGALWDGMMVALLLGSSIAIVERFSASRFWDDVRRFDARVAMGIFSMIPILLKKPPGPDDREHRLRAFYLGKSALDEELHARFGVRSVETYTSTEAGLVTGSPYGRWRKGSCGLANRETFEVKLVDEWDREVGPGEPGEIVIRPLRPFAVTTGYYNAAETTARCFRNLWFHTGDVATRDEDGYFYFVERTKDMIRRRGENISAFEVERAVNAHPAVLESAAFAVPSDVEEDEVKVAVVLQAGESLAPEELAAWCEERLPSFMVPRYLEFLGELPKTPIGKLSKTELRSRGDHGLTPETWDRESARTRRTRPVLVAGS